MPVRKGVGWGTKEDVEEIDAVRGRGRRQGLAMERAPVMGRERSMKALHFRRFWSDGLKGRPLGNNTSFEILQ